MRLAFNLAAFAMVAAIPAAAESVPAGLSVKVGTIRKTSIGVDVNFSITNDDGETVGIVFTTCTALDSDGQPKAKADDNVHNVKPGETAYGQAQFDEGEATIKDRFTCRIDEISR